jgi:transcriptional regulator with GAF, ATPase, and Fis domain
MGAMKTRSREDRLVATFVTVADTLVAEYDVVDLLQTLVDDCTGLFDAAAAGILLVAPNGELEVVVSTNESSDFLGIVQAKQGQGPCVEAITTGQLVSVPDLEDVATNWAFFADAALRSGYRSIHAMPMRLRQSTIGSLNLFRADVGRLAERDAVAAQALADVATISILQERAHRESDIAREQLQRALDSRVVIEQAKGILAQRHGVDMGRAFELIRSHARSNQLRLGDTAAAIVSGKLSL